MNRFARMAGSRIGVQVMLARGTAMLDKNFDWKAPVPMPGDGYIWGEENQQWVALPVEDQ